MRSPQKRNARQHRRLYYGGKISDYQFRRVIAHFTRDDSAGETAQHVRLSTNSIAAIFAKLRAFFFAYGLFRDPYRGGDPRAGLSVQGFEDIEHAILTFHLTRVAAKRGQLDAPLHGPDHHFSESNWRFNFHALLSERGEDAIRPMMEAHLMEFIRRFGPVGKPGEPSAQERLEGRRLADEQLDRMILWLERNSGKFRDPGERAELRKLRGQE